MKTESVATGACGRPSARYESLDLWRGIACLMIVLLHAGHYAKAHPEPGTEADRVGSALLGVVGRMGIGVQLFFVISGYCIAATVVSARRRGSPGVEFFTRRFRRIFPPYWAALVVMAVAVALQPVLGIGDRLTTPAEDGYPYVPPPSGLTISQWVGNLSLTETWRAHLIGGPESKLLGPAWSLCYEEQFYAVCGLLLLLVPGRFFTGVAVVTAATVALVVGTHAAGARVPVGFFFDGRWVLFACGVFVYLHLCDPPGGRKWVVPLLLGATLAASAWLQYVRLRNGADPILRQQVSEWVVGAGFALVLLALHRWDLRLAGARAMQPVAFCGRMCYSLYLIHWPVTLVVSIWLYHAGVRGTWPTMLITIPVATALSVVASWGFHRVVERRFLNTPQSGSARQQAAPAAANDAAAGVLPGGRLLPSPA
jgi:peptidoglycan/LPS O-acetylase OafA/YrhL